MSHWEIFNIPKRHHLQPPLRFRAFANTFSNFLPELSCAVRVICKHHSRFLPRDCCVRLVTEQFSLQPRDSSMARTEGMLAHPRSVRIYPFSSLGTRRVIFLSLITNGESCDAKKIQANSDNSNCGSLLLVCSDMGKLDMNDGTLILIVSVTPRPHRVRQRITHSKVTAHQNGSHICLWLSSYWSVCAPPWTRMGSNPTHALVHGAWCAGARGVAEGSGKRDPFPHERTLWKCEL